MLLLVGLANIIMERARLADAQQSGSSLASTSAEKKTDSDPLAVIGAVPSPEASSSTTLNKSAPNR